jgi:hypothetical protein
MARSIDINPVVVLWLLTDEYIFALLVSDVCTYFNSVKQRRFIDILWRHHRVANFWTRFLGALRNVSLWNIWSSIVKMGTRVVCLHVHGWILMSFDEERNHVVFPQVERVLLNFLRPLCWTLETCATLD